MEPSAAFSTHNLETPFIIQTTILGLFSGMQSKTKSAMLAELNQEALPTSPQSYRFLSTNGAGLPSRGADIQDIQMTQTRLGVSQST